MDENKSKEYNDYAADKSILDSKEFHEQLDLEDIFKEFNHDEFNEYIMEKVDTSIDDVTILPTQTGRNEIEDYADLKFKNILEDKKVDKENGEQAFSRVCFIDDPFCAGGYDPWPALRGRFLPQPWRHYGSYSSNPNTYCL